MTEVLFYIAEQPGIRARLAGRIADKAWRQGRRVYIHLPDETQARQLDADLWQQPVTGFLPHSLHGEEGSERAPVVLGWGDDPGPHHDVLVNLAEAVPDFYARFARVAEMICGDPALRSAGRTRWNFYRERGYPLTSHRL